jgi:anti-sigma factor RsiW
MSDERHNPGRERFEDLKEAYALGALSEEERWEIEDYLGTHPELRAEVDELRSVANLRWFVFGVVIRAMPRSVSWENDLLLTMTKKVVST